MILWDVNLWVSVHRSDSPLREAARMELDGEFPGADAYLFCPHAAVSFLRLVTNPRVFVHPSPVEEAWTSVDVLESRARAVRTDIDPMTYGTFKHVYLVSKAAGKSIPDALLTCIAIRHDATLVTADREFGRFEGLACRYLEG